MPHLSTYVALAHVSEQTLADSFRTVGHGHADHPDVLFTCEALAAMSDAHVEAIRPIAERYGEDPDVDEPERLHADGLGQVRAGGIGLLRDLQDLHLLATLVQSTWTVLLQGALGLRDHDLIEVTRAASGETARQLAWLTTHMKVIAPQTLIVER
jgi:hypothetical protein